MPGESCGVVVLYCSTYADFQAAECLPMAEGRCLCGSVRFSALAPYKWLTTCHCSMCRKHHGTLFSTLVAVERDNFAWLAGQEHIARFHSSAAFERTFCATCGATLPNVAAAMVFCPVGLLPTLEPKPKSQVHIMVDFKSPMHEITDSLPQFAEYPPGFGSAVASPAAPPAETGQIHGSCLCGTVAFAISTPPTRMVNCHCSRCRASRGSTYATNVFTGIENLQWTHGAAHVKTHKLADAALFTTSFCELCGSVLPARFEKVNRYLVPVGSLDSVLPIKPGLHIYVDSKLPWVEITDGLPQFAAMPPRERIVELMFGA